MKTMKTGRSVIDVLSSPEEQVKETYTAEAAVTNEVEGVCPKCNSSMSMARIPTHQVYWCSNCRVTTPISES